NSGWRRCRAAAIARVVLPMPGGPSSRGDRGVTLIDHQPARQELLQDLVLADPALFGGVRGAEWADNAQDFTGHMGIGHGNESPSGQKVRISVAGSHSPTSPARLPPTPVRALSAGNPAVRGGRGGCPS